MHKFKNGRLTPFTPKCMNKFNHRGKLVFGLESKYFFFTLTIYNTSNRVGVNENGMNSLDPHNITIELTSLRLNNNSSGRIRYERVSSIEYGMPIIN